jgi:hypothetical protein
LLRYRRAAKLACQRCDGAEAATRGVLLAAMEALSACGHTVVVAPDDARLAQMSARLHRTGTLVEAQQIPDGDLRLFMQAEGFYRYRLGPPPVTAQGYLVQAAAVVSELPAFQELAGALDIGDLRLKTYDGAVQLWETLLRRSPNSQLRPLTLYRLGWAYRNTGVAGLPRRDGNDAFAELARDFPGTTLARLGQSAQNVPWKSKDRATLWSLLPGAPQFYVGEYKSGSLRLGLGLGALAAFIVPTVLAIERGGDLALKHDWPLLLTGLAGVLVLSVDYSESYHDGVRSVLEFNETEERRFEAAHPDAY